MEKYFTINNRTNTTRASGLALKAIMNTVKEVFALPRTYYSYIIGKEISGKQTWLLIKTQASFFMAAFTSECPFILRVAFFLTFLYYLLKCKNSI